VIQPRAQFGGHRAKAALNNLTLSLSLVIAGNKRDLEWHHAWIDLHTAARFLVCDSAMLQMATWR